MYGVLFLYLYIHWFWRPLRGAVPFLMVLTAILQAVLLHMVLLAAARGLLNNKMLFLNAGGHCRGIRLGHGVQIWGPRRETLNFIIS